MTLFCLEELRSVLDEMNNLRRVLQIPVQIYCTNKNYIVSINIPEWWAIYRYLIYGMMGQSYYQSEAKNQNERYKGCRDALNARRGNFVQDLLSLYIFPLNRRKAVPHKFVRRTCLSVLYTGIACTLGFPFLGLAECLYDLKLAYLREKSLGKYDGIWKLILDGKMKTYLTNYHCPDVSAQKLNHYLAVMNLKKKPCGYS